MRKILIGGLGVAGLLATVLALASSPATSQMVVAFQTDTQPGEYTVSWSTRGGCDPSRPNADTTLATDGATGARSATVSVPGTAAATATVQDARGTEGDPGSTIGNEVEFSVAVAQHCTYDYSVTFTSSLGGSKGISCAVGYDINDAGAVAGTRDGVLTFVEVPGTFADEIEFNVEDGDGDATNGDESICNEVAKISVDVKRPKVPDVKDRDSDNDKTELIPDQPHSGAILNTTFTVGAQQVTAKNAPTNDECATVSEETEVDDVLDNNNGRDSTDDDTVGAVLTVVKTPLSDGTHTCAYDVGAIVPAGFEPRSRYSEGSRVVSYGLGDKVIPDRGDIDGDGVNEDDAVTGEDTDTDADTVPATLDDCGVTVVRTDTDSDLTTTGDQTSGIVGGKGGPCVTADLVVALRMMYILQNVVGDSGGANARYSLTLDKECAIPHDLPANLTGTVVGGIQTTKAVTVVELKEGFFNISAAVMGRGATDIDEYERTFAPRYALNKDGEACSFTAAVSHLPDNCDAAEESISANAVTGSDSHGRVIVTFDIGCSDDAADDEADADDGAADDMGDMDDDAAEADDDMGDMGDDDADDMGPPADEPTG